MKPNPRSEISRLIVPFGILYLLSKSSGTPTYFDIKHRLSEVIIACQRRGVLTAVVIIRQIVEQLAKHLSRMLGWLENAVKVKLVR